MTFQLSSLPRGSSEGTATALQNETEPDHLNLSTDPLFSAACSASSMPAIKALWDANSTPVCWGCQEGIPIYCISVLASGMLPPRPAFPQGGVSAENQVAHSSRATPDLPLFEFFRGLPGRGPKFPS